MEKQKTFHKQSGKLLGVIAEHMPEISTDYMQALIQRPQLVELMVTRMFRMPPRGQDDFFSRIPFKISINAQDDTIYSNTSFRSLLKDKSNGGLFERVFINDGEGESINLYHKRIEGKPYYLSPKYVKMRPDLFERMSMAMMQQVCQLYGYYEACLIANKLAEKNLVPEGQTAIVLTPLVDLSEKKILCLMVVRGKYVPDNAPEVFVQKLSFDYKSMMIDLNESFFVF